MPIIPKPTRMSEAFQKDFSLAFSQPSRVLEALVDVITAAPTSPRGIEDADIDSVATEHSVAPTDLETTAAVLRFLASAVALSEIDADPMSEFLGFAEEIGGRIETDQWRTLAPILDRGGLFQRRLEESLTFHDTPGYEESDFDIVFRPARSDPQLLLPGIRWTVRYHNASGDPDVMSFSLSATELERIREEADRALNEVAKYRSGGALEVAPPSEPSQ